jgi:hypothetical protein
VCAGPSFASSGCRHCISGIVLQEELAVGDLIVIADVLEVFDCRDMRMR